MQHQIKSFIVGSSLPATIVSLLYIGRAHKQYTAQKPFHFADAAIAIPIVYGLFNVLALHAIARFQIKRKRLFFTFMGVLCGLTFASAGTSMGANRMFGLDGGEQFGYAALLYAAIFGLLVFQVNRVAGLV